MNTFYSSLLYVETVIKSRYIRRTLIDKGIEYTIDKHPKLGGKQLLRAEEIQSLIKQKLTSDEPFMAGRFGGVEISNTGKIVTGLDYKLDQSINTLCNNAGFFPNSKQAVDKFAEIMVDSMSYCDVQGVWYMPYEEYFVSKYLNDRCQLTEGRYLEPWFSRNPWTEALEHKRVLVVHPFVESIKKQYQRRRLLFDPQSKYLPDFELHTLQAVQTIAGTKDARFETWFDALDYMEEEALKTTFDIAILGCGAYGYPLAARLKRAGKKALHLGGVTQILFGIKGKRWEEDKNPIIRELFNEYWIRPDQSEIPQNKSNVENGCYW